MKSTSASPERWTWFSPWFIIGSVCILAAVLSTLAVKNFHREKEFMLRTLLSEASVLMRTFEAGTRAGVKGPGWGLKEVQTLMEEIAQQPDVLYVALVDGKGKVVAHSDPEQVGKVLPVTLPKRGETLHRFTEEGEKGFEVIRPYHPWVNPPPKKPKKKTRTTRTTRERQPPPKPEFEKDVYLLLALDPEPMEDALRQDLQHTAVLFGIMFLVGAAGFISLILAQDYRIARRSLRDIEAFTTTLVNQMPIGLLATDRSGGIQRSNEAARSILGISERITGNIADLPSFGPVAEQLATHESVVEHEVQFPVDEDRSVPLLVNAAVIHDADLNPAGFVFLFADMTGIKQLEEQLRRSERLAALGRLAAGVAHEIRNPLSSIKGFATILAGRFREDDRDRKIARVMEQEVERLNRVITELLDFARPTALHLQSSACRELIEHSLRLVDHEVRQRGVAVEVRVEPEDMQIRVDPDRFGQVLLNLCLNALQAMEDGGNLRIEAFRKTGLTVVSVSDTGAGIPPEHIPHIFDPYFTTKPSGVGLGLANVHKIVEAHGGEIEALSSPGVMTSFIIRLPAEEREQAA